MKPTETITVTVKAASGWGDVPLAARLKRWLKAGLRGHGIRVVTITTTEDQATELADRSDGGGRNSASRNPGYRP